MEDVLLVVFLLKTTNKCILRVIMAFIIIVFD